MVSVCKHCTNVIARCQKHNLSDMNQKNHVGEKSVIKAMRHALLECVPLMTRQWSKLYSGHSLRVGGSNHIRKLGISDQVHRLLGGWVSLVSSQRYFQLSEDEQLDRAEEYALKERTPPRVEGAKLVTMESIQGLEIEG